MFLRAYCRRRSFLTTSRRELTVDSGFKPSFRVDEVLGNRNRDSFVERFRRYKTSRMLRNDINQAAVLVPLCIYKSQPGLLYTLRSTKVSANRGQVSFPGGMFDKSDRNLEDTALRETREELGIPRGKIDVWTQGNMIGKKNINVMPIVGCVGKIDPEKLRINPDEVEEAFIVTLKDLCDPALFRYTQFRDSYTLPVYLGGKHRIWGFTGAITHMVLSSLVPGAYKHTLSHVRPVLQKPKGGSSISTTNQTLL